MKVIDKKARLFGKVSVIDILIIVVLLAALFFVYTYFVKGTPEVVMNEEKEAIEFVVEVKNIHNDIEVKPTIGQPIYNSNNNTYIGEIADVSILPDEVILTDYESGEFRLIEEEGQKRMLITVSADADLTDRYTLVGSEKIRVGQQLNVKGKGFAGFSYIVEVRK